jgi:alanyl-tRNA synthetase
VTERLYYRDSLLREFDAQVLSCEPEGGRWRVLLDRTAFYPTSGGQPHDTGKLGGASVVEVADVGDDTVVHYTSAAVARGPIHASIDWPRRVDHMQQHTGQHLLSAAFVELFNFHTVSFHLGRDISTIDLDAPSIVPRHLEEAERRTNEIILEDRVVAVRFGTAEELAEAGIRKKVDREGVLRAIEVEGFDRQPCGGTHLARTGQAGLLLVRKLECRRDAWRVEFVCGFRALAAARADYATLTQTASLLSCGLPDVPGVVAKTLEERRAQHGAGKRLEERLADLEARALLAQAVQSPQAADAHGSTAGETLRRVVTAILDDATPAYLGMLAAKIIAEPSVIVLLASRAMGHVVFAQTKGGSADMGKLLRENLQLFGGKGGGPKDFAQGSLPKPCDLDALLSRAQAALATGRVERHPSMGSST